MPTDPLTLAAFPSSRPTAVTCPLCGNVLRSFSQILPSPYLLVFCPVPGCKYYTSSRFSEPQNVFVVENWASSSSLLFSPEELDSFVPG